MNRVALLLATALLFQFSCSADGGPSLAVTDVSVYAPVPGSGSSVAYMTLQNKGNADVIIEAAASPQFRRVELHETSLEDGVSRMRPVSSLSVPAGGEVQLMQGGVHLMLLEPRQDLQSGDTVSLEIQHNEGLLIVDATLQSRFAVNE